MKFKIDRHVGMNIMWKYVTPSHVPSQALQRERLRPLRETHLLPFPISWIGGILISAISIERERERERGGNSCQLPWHEFCEPFNLFACFVSSKPPKVSHIL